jgi:hypothetical protein
VRGHARRTGVLTPWELLRLWLAPCAAHTHTRTHTRTRTRTAALQP